MEAELGLHGHISGDLIGTMLGVFWPSDRKYESFCVVEYAVIALNLYSRNSLIEKDKWLWGSYDDVV